MEDIVRRGAYIETSAYKHSLHQRSISYAK